MASGVRPLGRRKSSLVRWIFLFLVTIYAGLVFQLHKLEVVSDHITTTTNNIVVPPPNFQRIKSEQDNKAVVMPAPPAVPINIHTSIVDGQVQHYLDSGKNLWEHSTILPDWMKRTFLSINFVLADIVQI